MDTPLPDMFSLSGQLEVIKQKVTSKFQVKDLFYDRGVLTFEVEPGDHKIKFKQLTIELKSLNSLPTLSLEDGRLLLRILEFRRRPSKRTRVPLILLLATVGTISVDGALRILLDPHYQELISPVTLPKLILYVSIYTAILLGVFGLHELGHKIAAARKGMDSSLPYFIPGVPGWQPTMGAVIFQREPATNRDELFDLGFSGPLVGFLVTVVATALTFATAPVPTPAQWQNWMASGAEFQAFPVPLLFDIMISAVVPNSQGMYLTPLILACWLGSMVTALNLMPVWQLDGSKTFNAVLPRRVQKIVSYAALAVLFLTGWFFFAFILLFLMPRTPHVPPLDRYSPLTRSRKLAFVGALFMLGLTYVVNFQVYAAFLP
ncbi:MAG: site-2 protease family protein [Nitrososphaeria archaeon]